MYYSSYNILYQVEIQSNVAHTQTLTNNHKLGFETNMTKCPRPKDKNSGTKTYESILIK